MVGIIAGVFDMMDLVGYVEEGTEEGALDGCFEVLGKSAIAIEPHEDTFDPPARWQQDKAF